MTTHTDSHDLVLAGPDPFEVLAKDYASARGLGIEVLMMVGSGGQSRGTSGSL